MRPLLIQVGIAAGLGLFTGGAASAQTPGPAGTAFSYQGRLRDGGAPASGAYDLRFTLFGTVTGGTPIGTPVIADDVMVTGGLFTVLLDFGAAAFDGDARWLEIAVRPGSSTGAFTPVAPRGVLTPTPHVLFSARTLHSLSTGTATTATNSQHSVTSDTATTATNSQHSLTSDTTPTATDSQHSLTSDAATNAVTSQHSVASDTATTATTSTHSLTSDTATTATTSQHSVTTDTATNATNSQHSTTSDSSVTTQSADVVPWTGVTGKPAGFADDVDHDTLAALSCASGGYVAKWTGSAWACAADSDTSGADWSRGGNASTGGAALLGTLDREPFRLVVNNVRAFQIAPATGFFTDSPSVTGGVVQNVASGDGSTIWGGGSGDFDVGPNTATGPFGTIRGGAVNSAKGSRAVTAGGLNTHADGDITAVGGGEFNYASAVGGGSNVSGGFFNVAAGRYASVGGGQHHSSDDWATVRGGAFNEAASYGTVGGGDTNRVSGTGTVPGGGVSRAQGRGGFAAGTRAEALHDGAFVWSTVTTVSSTGVDQFIVRAGGGIWFGTTSAPDLSAGFLNTSTGAYLSSGGVWTNASDRRVKEGFEPIDGARLLDQLARLPITRWRYTGSPGVRHIGPMAQDFRAIVGVGDSDTAISTIDPAGVALATIQALHRQLEAQTAALAALEAQAAAKDAQLAALRGVLQTMKDQLPDTSRSPR